MTDDTTTTSSSTTDSSESTDTATESSSRTRTRSRSRAKRSSQDGADADRGKDDAGSRDGGKGGSGRGGSGKDDASKGGSSKDESKGGSSKDDASGGGGGDDDGDQKKRSRRGRRGRRGRGKKSGGGSASTEQKDTGSKDEDDAIRPGGTRMAAKRNNRSGGSGRSSRGRVQGVPEDVRRAMLDGPPKTMLVSVDDQRTQIAVLEDRSLVEHSVTRKSDVTLVGNIYMARVQNVLPGMEAAFLDIGKGRNGVLYAGEVLYDDLDVEEGDTPRIEDALQSGQKVLVQVTKDAMGSKGPRLTMQLSLAGRYTVLAPNSDVFGISRKLTDKERDRLRKIVKKSKPAEHGVIVRTAAEDIPEDQITADLQRLLRTWDRVQETAEGAKALEVVYEEPPLHVKVIRDTFGTDYEACIIDDADVYDAVREYLDEVAPDLAEKVSLYGTARWEREHDRASESEDDGTTEAADSGNGDKPKFAQLFDAYNVTEQLRKAMSRKVWLPSGGYLIIETTEAMKVIDVNTGKFTGNGKQSLEEVVLKTNLEAAEEIVRQLRLRDMGGIIIIDFIDMLLKANQDQVVRRLKRELLRDRTKTRVSDVSRLGLVQMTRKNVSAGLVESFSQKCDTCDGRGFVNEFD